MSKIKLEDPIKELRGKICKHADTIYKQMYGTKFTSRICNPRTTPYSTDELSRQDKFRQASQATKAILADATQRAEAVANFQAQKKYRSLWGFIHAQEYAKL